MIDKRKLGQCKIVVEYDVLRVILTLLVIIGHCTYYVISTPYGGCDYSTYAESGLSLFYKLIEASTNAIYLFHMPLYMALSGALYRLKNTVGGGYSSYKSLITDKAKKLLLPFIVVTLLYSVPLKYISGYYSNSNNILKDILIGQVLVHGNTHLWFLPALFLIFIIIYPLEKNFKKVGGRDITLCLFAVSLASSIIPKSIVHQALYYAFWFYIGYCFENNREKMNVYLEKKPGLSFIFAIIFLVAGLAKKFISGLAGIFTICSVSEYLIGYICAGLGCYVVYSLSYYLSKTDIINWQMFKTIRANSLGLYLYSDTLNYVILNIATMLFGSAIFVTNVGAVLLYIIRIIITFSIALAVVMLLKKHKIKYVC